MVETMNFYKILITKYVIEMYIPNGYLIAFKHILAEVS